jgi:hypothetical protein
MIKLGFDLLKTRSLSEQLDIAALEKKCGILLPKMYRLFAETFYLGKEYMQIDKYYSNKFKENYNIYSYNHTNDEIGFSEFIDLESAFNVYSSGGLSDQDYRNEYFPIADASLGGLFVGTRNDADKIIWDTKRLDNKYEVVADNIFEFVRGLEVKKISGGTAHYQFDYSKLYKNWGEDFWRLRE